MDGEADLTEIGITVERIARAYSLETEVGRHVEKALSGENTDTVKRCLERAQQKPSEISLEFLALLVHFRVNAAAWLVIKDYVDMILVPHGRGANVMSTDPGDTTIDPHVHFGNSRYRLPGGVLDVPLQTLPETLSISAVGLPLHQIVTHPALDGMAHIITGIKNTDGSIEIRYGDHHPMIAVADLHEGLMWPDPRAMQAIHTLASGLRKTDQ